MQLMHRPTNYKMATENDVYDVVLASSSYLYTFSNFLVVEIDKLDLGGSEFMTCCVVEMTGEYARLVQ